MSISIPATVAKIDEPWSPHLVARLNDHDVKVAKLHGEFVFHQHPDTDELFYVLAGTVTIKVEDGQDIDLAPGDVYVVPKGVRHCPVANQATAMIIEKVGTINTGDAETNRTKKVKDVRH